MNECKEVILLVYANATSLNVPQILLKDDDREIPIEILPSITDAVNIILNLDFDQLNVEQCIDCIVELLPWPPQMDTQSKENRMLTRIPTISKLFSQNKISIEMDESICLKLFVSHEEIAYVRNELWSTDFETFLFAIYAYRFYKDLVETAGSESDFICAIMRQKLKFQVFTIYSMNNVTNSSSTITTKEPLCAIQIPIYGLSKQYYPIAAKLCEQSIRFVEIEHSSNADNILVRYVTPNDQILIQNASIQTQLIELGWYPNQRTKHLFSPAEQNVILLVAPQSRLQEYKDVCTDILTKCEVPFKPIPRSLLDLSHHAYTSICNRKNYLNPSELRIEMEKLGPEMNLLTHINLSDNDLGWNDYENDFNWLLELQLPKLIHLDLTENQIGGKPFCEWLQKMVEIYPNIQFQFSTIDSQFVIPYMKEVPSNVIWKD